jgi:hypothetical protein
MLSVIARAIALAIPVQADRQRTVLREGHPEVYDCDETFKRFISIDGE